MIASLLVLHLTLAMDDFKTEQLKWRSEVEADLRKPEGWLSVAGLFWLNEGPNRVGVNPNFEVVLPSRLKFNGPVATIHCSKNEVSIETLERSKVHVNGISVSKAVLKPDTSGHPDTVQIDDITFKIIVRGNRTGVRLYDSKSKAMESFKGCRWYAPVKNYQFKAKYIAYDPPHTTNIVNVIGDITPVKIPGYVEFKFKGQVYKLDAQDAGDGLFFNFKDATNGRTTYDAGRFLDAPKPVDGIVDLDFNKATNPPCAFTAFATCPLPPKENILAVAIQAGEKAHHPVH